MIRPKRIAVDSVKKSSPTAPIWSSISEVIQERNHTNAEFVTMRALKAANSLVICELTVNRARFVYTEDYRQKVYVYGEVKTELWKRKKSFLSKNWKDQAGNNYNNKIIIKYLIQRICNIENIFFAILKLVFRTLSTVIFAVCRSLCTPLWKSICANAWLIISEGKSITVIKMIQRLPIWGDVSPLACQRNQKLLTEVSPYWIKITIFCCFWYEVITKFSVLLCPFLSKSW